MTLRSADQIRADLAGVLRQAFPDREYSGPAGGDARLFADLGLASIDVVVLAEKLEAFYGRKLPFPAFLNGLRQRGADDIALGDLVEFLQPNVGGP